MKICVIGFTKLKYMPYMQFYLQNISVRSNEIHILYWNRDCKEENLNPFRDYTLHEFIQEQRDDVPKLKKLASFRRYRFFAKGLLKAEKFDFIIILHTLPGLLLFDEACGWYKYRYILDYRDYTYESNKIYRGAIDKLVRYSRNTYVSSDAFRKYLPKMEKVITSHNIIPDSLKHRQYGQHTLEPVRVCYWGLIRYEDTHIKLIRKICNDKRFEFHFYGREQSECECIRAYCEKNNVCNVFFHGEYLPDERYEFAKHTDLIQNVQDFDRITENAVSNKFYDGALFYIPQICSDQSYMGKCAERYGIGLACNVDTENIAEVIYTYLKELDWKQFVKNCDAFVNQVMMEYETGVDKLHELFR